MNYQIALSPQLGLPPHDFVQGWNTSDEARVAAEAHLAPSSTSQFDPFLLEALAVLSTVGVGMATNALYDLVKQVVIKKTGHHHTRITQVDQPDGTHILIVDFQDE